MDRTHSPTISPLGDSAAIVVWNETESAQAETNQARLAIRAYAAEVERRNNSAIVAVVSAYSSVTVHYDPLLNDWNQVANWLAEIASTKFQHGPGSIRCVDIPVCYDEEFGWDLYELAEFAQVTVAELIRLHSEPTYSVQMIGFAPGFPYLAGLPSKLAMPRRSTPRISVPAGSVGIGGRQTGIYSLATPGGWRIIGRTPVQLFFPNREPPTLLFPGDQVRFRPVSRAEFLQLGGTI